MKIRNRVTLFYKHLTVIDFAYWDQCAGEARGNSLYANISLTGVTDDEGVIFDFSLAKKKIKSLIDDKCDHRLLLGEGERLPSYKAPEEAYCYLAGYPVYNKENFASYLQEMLLPELPKNVESITVELEEEKIEEGASLFYYTHGLKEHYGNCQRLLHGHASTIEIYVDDQRNYDLEKWLLEEEFKGSIHFIYQENILKESEDQITVGYCASQGQFEMRLMKHQVYVLPEETTVENLSKMFSHLIREKKQLYNETIKVVAFEGIGKGAVTILEGE